ncbi:deoxyguanosinetriphosphate triphosphohydrolase [Selenomonas ruminis]|uniref:Deoxyguanosinetriphosphate triphosphohydrolase n=1 Tax=Selenomonas ruminis TaxID=2593411 RepID=A0A5D6W779_9FIRM|nr:deoxyguanosinetriphosphate triphosphohydrolase [Selenomonas sp. mPRGC5]TYZ22574.1 deoxyguanosinetriphosphate triphosphohydrolase [Selenomonas sp. mPRGC5]
MNVRERLEAQEDEILSSYAAKSRDARRKFPMEECQFRTKFQRDRDRILHSKSFRRLKHKTQVYIVSGDHYRTRMTHSLEVSQISRTIARGLRLNEDLAEAIALGHDVGHTPFGHAGEAAMAKLTGHFAHNEQSLRVVEFLERSGKGLNLTFEVKDGIVNHTGPVMPKTLEGRIVRTADRIAYLCHDYDDSLRAGLLQPGDLPKLVYERLGEDTSAMITSMVSDMIVSSMDKDDISLSAEVKEAMDTFRSFMFEHIYHSETLAHERRQAVYVLRALYEWFVEHFEELPAEFVRREERWGRQKIVTDYVAGLTDSYAVQLFNEIFMPPVGFMVH